MKISIPAGQWQHLLSWWHCHRCFATRLQPPRAPGPPRGAQGTLEQGEILPTFPFPGHFHRFLANRRRARYWQVSAHTFRAFALKTRAQGHYRNSAPFISGGFHVLNPTAEPQR